MRWEPLLIILLIAGLSGLFVLTTTVNRSHRWLALVSLSYLTGLAAIVFTPLSFTGTAVYIMPPGLGRVNLTALDIMNLGFAENILLTLPLGVLVKRLWAQLPLLGVALFGFVASGSIEVGQYLLSHHWLINRSSDINDVVANTLGVILGGLIGASYLAIKRHTRRKLRLAQAS
ncbi:VanZ family protein [Levilactobacillus suantsaii]|uniref:VanZ family protein n=1 Tax=Levilactobacillus suantsaii TaxID=2292255 RepID=A0A4Q0VHY4_9LACO|nr:VanZ family protein [Levilactobacillus suantsaii]QMU07665.1 VanZ family protein [Levilactobacillus suantsaii]RXI78646.1 VanZ family protein [Levilactobacillus suantsaii]